MTSIERTAYPQFKRLTSARVLHVFFTPSEDEAAWARERTETPMATIRGEVNEAIFAGITGRMGPEGRQRAQGLLDTAGSDGRSMFNRLKPAQRATWSRFKAQAEYLDEVDALGDTACWVEGVAPSKVADFAGEAAVQDIDTLSRYGDAKKLALVACLAHTARMQARDDLAEMLCRPRSADRVVT